MKTYLITAEIGLPSLASWASRSARVFGSQNATASSIAVLSNATAREISEELRSLFGDDLPHVVAEVGSDAAGLSTAAFWKLVVQGNARPEASTTPSRSSDSPRRRDALGSRRSRKVLAGSARLRPPGAMERGTRVSRRLKLSGVVPHASPSQADDANPTSEELPTIPQSSQE